MDEINVLLDVLVLGSGGREHALVKAIQRSPNVGKVYAAPGNGGTDVDAKNVNLNINDPAAVVTKAQELLVDLVVIGPEQPLVNGVADALRAADILVFGPGADGARIEGSKQFAKEFMDKHALPTAAWGRFTDAESALNYLDSQGAPIVVKADGLAAGKGVTVAATLDEARDAVKECFDGRFGSAGMTVVIEECLTGPECSLLVFTDGYRMLPMAPAQDHKRVGEGDTGPNTGGMGVYSPVPIVSEQEHAAMLDIMQKAVSGFAADEIDYRGILYGGFMLTPTGPKLLEFNARFGDPEAQVLLPRLESDLLELLLRVAEGDLIDMELEWSDDWVVSVVMASGGYPGDYETGKTITGIERAEQLSGVTVFHAGTALDETGQPYTTGGRVLNVTAQAASFSEARELAYQAVGLIDFQDKIFRSDIGGKAMLGREAWS
ncbi:MAG: phosphoribosylamine--glycine ligase [Coriobacteriia bacterium]|nr:phosphoribosylamine--glycine ligase [Coriobacteriia bacterium]